MNDKVGIAATVLLTACLTSSIWLMAVGDGTFDLIKGYMESKKDLSSLQSKREQLQLERDIYRLQIERGFWKATVERAKQEGLIEGLSEEF